ncbi:MAG: DUF5916 domain-containing protein, partial [Gemmatimonadota bacterium]
APDSAASRTYRGDAGQLRVSPPRLEHPGIRVDGVLDEAAWRSAARLSGFTQYDPVEGAPPAQETEVLVFYTRDAIYFGIRALDRHPEQIEMTVGERDRSVFADDWIRLMLDTFNDDRQAYLFYINPLGIQTDGFWIEGLQREGGSPFPIDFNPDFVWESHGRVTHDGWMAEIRIPYISLQFENKPVQTWGFNVAREVKRLGHKQSWAPLTQNVASTLEQSGRLVGLRDLAPRRLIELNPVTTGKITGQRTGEAFHRGSVQPELGLNARYGITRNLVAGATINPDFSQVEADADQITVNERFAIFFAEKRRFFLEGTEIFESPTRLVHTRQIIDPVAGAKVTGKLGSVKLAYLGALDESPLSLGENGHRALFNLARVRKDVGSGSTVGLLYTDRSATGGGEFNRVASADARLLFGGRYTLTAQLAGSWTASGEPADPVRFGPLFYLSLKRSGRRAGFELRTEDVHPDFLAGSGFIRRVGDVRTFASGRYTHFSRAGAGLESWGFELRLDGFSNYRDFFSGRERSPFESEIQLHTNLSFKGRRTMSLILRNGYFRFRPEAYAGYEVETGAGGPVPFSVPPALTHMWAGALTTRSRISRALQINGRLFYREQPIFVEAARGRELLLSPGFTVRPTGSLSLDLSYAYSRIWRERDGTLFSSADIPRLKAQYQFDRAVFARVILQYDLSTRDALRDPTTERPLSIDGRAGGREERGRFLSQLLFSYEPSPGTRFFIGWSREMEGDRTFSLRRLEPTTEGFFAKLSYLYRL